MRIRPDILILQCIYFCPGLESSQLESDECARNFPRRVKLKNACLSSPGLLCGCVKTPVEASQRRDFGTI